MNTTTIHRKRHMLSKLLLSMTLCVATAMAEEVSDGWQIESKEPGVQVMTFEMSLHPHVEPKPALKHRLTPDLYDQVPGNASIYYLKALGFLEESAARQEIDKFEREAAEQAQKAGADDYPPYVWMKTPPGQLPTDEVKQFLKFLDFQPGLIQEAKKRHQFDLDRRIRETENPLMYLLPEIQVMRQLARYQTLRARLAMSEDRIDDAIEVLGQQYAMAHHLGSDEFLVSNLVGAAIAAAAWNDTVHLLNHPKAPNLYWAFASLPKPLIDMSNALSFERQLLFEQVKCFREVTEKVRPEGYWQDFLDRFEEQMGPILEHEASMRRSDHADERRAATIAVLAAAYPGARKFLSQELKMSDEQIEQYPRVQAVLLAMKRYYEFARDEQFKWDFLPFPDASAAVAKQSLSDQLSADEKAFGWITKPAGILLPALTAIRIAQQRVEQQIAMAQTIETIRHHAATHGRKLPATLAELELPAPNDPYSGKPFQYDYQQNKATIIGGLPRTGGHLQYRLIVRIANH